MKDAPVVIIGVGVLMDQSLRAAARWCMADPAIRLGYYASKSLKIHSRS
jgi:hypothetical protein